MPKARGLRWALAFLFCSIAASAWAAAPKDSAPASTGKAAETKSVADDPLGRSTPYGSVMGFLRVADKNEYELAARYLEGRQSPQKKAELARNLKVVLNRGLKIGPEDVSKAQEGHLDDDLNPYLEKIGTATYPGAVSISCFDARRARTVRRSGCFHPRHWWAWRWLPTSSSSGGARRSGRIRSGITRYFRIRSSCW